MELTIEGKRFVPLANGTFAHDIWITKKIREAGLAGDVLAMREGETQDQLIERVAISAYESGLALQLLGGLLIPADVDPRAWTPELAMQSAEFFGNVTDAEAKKVLRTQIASALFYFLATALASLPTSRKSGATTKEGERHATADASSSETGAT
ncbi:MAG TPA: hypothetical protein VF450_08305 [Noviherbaspirillum sp.]